MKLLFDSKTSIIKTYEYYIGAFRNRSETSSVKFGYNCPHDYNSNTSNEKGAFGYIRPLYISLH